MASEFGTSICRLPLIAATELKKHRVHEPLDTRFRSAARSRSNIPKAYATGVCRRAPSPPRKRGRPRPLPEYGPARCVAAGRRRVKFQPSAML